jgi:hypothetical protein
MASGLSLFSKREHGQTRNRSPISATQDPAPATYQMHKYMPGRGEGRSCMKKANVDQF